MYPQSCGTTPVLEAVSHDTTHYADCHFVLFDPAFQLKKTSDLFGHSVFEKHHVFQLLVSGTQSVSHVSGHTTLQPPALLSRNIVEGENQKGQAVSVRQRRRPLRRGQQASHKKRNMSATTKTPSRAHADNLQKSATFVNACNLSCVHCGEESLLSRCSRARKKSLAFARHLPPNQPILRRAQHTQNTLACAQIALASGRCAHLSAPWTPLCLTPHFICRAFTSR